MSKIVEYVEIDVPTFDVQSPEETTTYRFARDAQYLPGDIDAFPLIRQVDFRAQRISLGKDLGQRASVTVTLNDMRYVFGTEDFDSGTFWGKWRGRYGTKLRGRPFRLIRGTSTQTLAQMDTRHYLIENVAGPSFDGVYTIEAKDILKFADDDRAQAPALSTAVLAAPIVAADTTITLSPTGIGDVEFPASGEACIAGKEIVSFTRVGDTLTVTRSQFGTVADDDNDTSDRVQLCLRYTGDDAADVVYDLLTTYADVPASYIDLAEWQQETGDFLNVLYARVIPDPTSVKKLVEELVEQAGLALWWDDRAQRLKLNVIREVATDTDTFDETSMIDRSFTVQEQPARRISRIFTYYKQRDPTDGAAKEENFARTLLDIEAGLETEYGSPATRKIFGKWIETESAASRHNLLKLSRFKNPPRAFSFDLFRTVSVTPAAGYLLKWWGSQDSEGNLVSVPVQITKVQTFPDRIRVEAEEMLVQTGEITIVNVEFLLTTGSLLEWPVPEDWNDADNEVHCIGGGGGGEDGTQGGGSIAAGGGGGAGAYSGSTNLSFGSPGQLVQYRVGAAGPGAVFTGSPVGDGGDTWFDGGTFGTATVAAEGGGGATGSGGGIGGDAANGTGDVKYSGGNGGSGPGSSFGAPGGGGAAGPNGDGGNGGTTNLVDNGQGGGGADDGDADATIYFPTGRGGNNRLGYGGGTTDSPNGVDGGGGQGGDDGDPVVGNGGAGEQIWTQTVAPIISAGPGGGGGGGDRDADGGDGGLYGGGGGGGGGSSVAVNGDGGDGAQGIIVIKWRPAA